MLLLNKYIKIFILIASLSYGQDVYSAYGVGDLTFAPNAAVVGIGSSGLMPSFQENISLSNPSTWLGIPFAYLSVNYGGTQIKDRNYDYNNMLSGLNQFQFILPIKGLFAVGIGFKPYSSQLYSLSSNNIYEKFIEGDTLTINKAINGSGGISGLIFSLGAKITEKEQLGLKIEYLFGSNRRQTVFNIKEDGHDLDYIYNQRNIYNGTLIDGYFSSNRFSFGSRKIFLSGSVKTVLHPLRINHFSFQPFEDSNGNGYYDIADYPRPTGVDSIPPAAIDTMLSNQISPFEYAFGFDLELTEMIHAQGEVSLWSDLNDSKTNLTSGLNQRILSYQHFNIGIIRFARALPRIWHESLHFRGGIIKRSYELENQLFSNGQSENYNINDIGLSIGFGIIFGVTKNQIDFGLNLINRSDSHSSDKLITNFNIGISIGDLWFVKRRVKK